MIYPQEEKNEITELGFVRYFLTNMPCRTIWGKNEGGPILLEEIIIICHTNAGKQENERKKQALKLTTIATASS